MAHIYLPDKRHLAFYLLRRHMLHVGGVESGTDLAENLLYGSGAEGSFAEHIFVTRFCMKLYYSDACAFLAAVVLFLHHQIEFG